jgi:hypothetical protein
MLLASRLAALRGLIARLHLVAPGPAAAPPDPTRHFDTLAAWREGWTILHCGHHEDGSDDIHLQRLDPPLHQGCPVFRDDGEAWQHVVERARQGSLLHLAALALVDRRERRIIEITCGPWRRPS